MQWMMMLIPLNTDTVMYRSLTNQLGWTSVVVLVLYILLFLSVEGGERLVILCENKQK